MIKAAFALLLINGERYVNGILFNGGQARTVVR